MLKHKYKIAAISICLVFFSLALFSSAGFSWSASGQKFSGNGILADEIPHIAGGYYYLKTQRYFINPEHPPLVKDIAGLGEFFACPAFPNITDVGTLPDGYQRPIFPFQSSEFPKALEWQNNQDHFGVMYLFHPENNPDVVAFWARLAVIFANTLFLFLLFALLGKIWAERAALLGLFFFAVSQFAIAHGSFVVIDFMSAILTVLAIVSFAIYLKKFKDKEKTGLYFFLSSLLFALALLSKFSSIVLLPAAVFGGLVYVLATKKEWGDVSKYILSAVAVLTLAFFIISAVYLFHVANMENDILIKKINENYPEENLPAWGHGVLAAMVEGSLLAKGLAAYANGVFMVMSRMVVSAQSTYFMGAVYGNEGAGLSYFPMLYLTKLSLGLHLFSILGMVFVLSGLRKGYKKLKEKWKNFVENPLSLLLVVFSIFYMLITFSSTFQIGLRHIMPVILSLALLTGKGVDSFWETIFLRLSLGSVPRLSLRLKHLFLAVALLMTLSALCSFPYYLSYYNALAGGTDNGYKIATDSNYDWGGSDVRRLAEWMRENDVKDIHTQIFADVPLKYYLGDGQKYFNLQDEGKPPPSGSYLAVSVFEYMNNVYSKDIPPERKYTTLKEALVARAGKTIFVYKIP